VEQRIFGAEFFATSDGGVAVVVYSIDLPNQLEELSQAERRPPRHVDAYPIIVLTALVLCGAAAAQRNVQLETCMAQARARFDACIKSCPGQNANGSVNPQLSQQFYACQKRCNDALTSGQKSCRGTAGMKVPEAKKPVGLAELFDSLIASR
jgi:hypothetical protein